MRKLRNVLFLVFTVSLFNCTNLFGQDSNNATVQKPNLQTWKTISLGTANLKSAGDLRKLTKEANLIITEEADIFLDKIDFSEIKTETKVDLVLLTVADMGFRDGTFGKDIYQKAKELGLKLCPAETGPQLRIQYPDQKFYENLVIGMVPIKDSAGELTIFSVDHTYRGVELNTHWGDPKGFWNGPKWVFCK